MFAVNAMSLFKDIILHSKEAIQYAITDSLSTPCFQLQATFFFLIIIGDYAHSVKAPTINGGNL